MPRKPAIRMSPTEWRASHSLAAVYALRMLGMFLVLPVLALHAHSLIPDDAPPEQRAYMVGAAMGVYGLTQALLQLPLGMLSDRFGRKPVIYAGLAVFAAGCFLAAAAETPQMLIIARAIQGAGAVSAAVTALLADLTREEVRTRAMSMIGLTIGLSFSAGMVLSPVLSDLLGGVSGLFALMGALTLTSIVVVAAVTPNPACSRLHQDTQTQAGRIGEVLKNTQLLRLNFGIFALQSGLMAIFTVLPLALRELGWERAEHWKLYLPATLVGLVLMIPAIIIGETRNKLKPVFVSGIVLVLAAQAAMGGSTGSIWGITLCLTVYFIGFNILEASMPSLVSKIAPSELKGTAMGVYNTLQSVGVFAGSMMGSKMYALYGYHGAFAFCCAIVAVWLLLAATAPAPLPVKNLVFAVPEAHRADLPALARAVAAVAGVQTVSFSEDGQTLFVKALQHGFDEAELTPILIGEQPCP
ncbi:MFS transporter [Conchiformibius kuhniae]|uniref:MFS transporter n=1 Tax=Conchiformibius kuhniae TaxID=211502 RepID=A0ABD8B7W9_9NEIS|nr:MFS transporter [Conchiformibius kuhniae]